MSQDQFVPQHNISSKCEESQPPDPSANLPPNSGLKALLDIYFSRIHSLLPVLDEDETRSQLSEGRAPVAILQAICLVTCKELKDRHTCV